MSAAETTTSGPVTEGGERIFVALDTPDIALATKNAAALKGHVGGVKLGKEFFTANGPGGVMAVSLAKLPIFLDLKFHDIPNTVAGAVRAIGHIELAMMTIHASGGSEMIRAACEAAAQSAAKFGTPKPLILAVTALTSLKDADMPRLGISGTAADQVRRLADLAREAGADGIVCSPHEVAALPARLRPDFRLVPPRIRPAGSASGDQQRVMTPGEAVAQGADYLVIGRPITQAGDPVAAADAIATEINAETPPRAKG